MENIVQPQAIVTLKVAHEHDKTLWVTERPSQVVARIQDAKSGQGPNAPMIELTRWRAMHTDVFYTRFDNVTNVESYR